jgi:hypothetical protein
MGAYASLAGFAEHRYPKDSNYPMTSRSTTGHKNHSHGCRIIYKQ